MLLLGSVGLVLVVGAGRLAAGSEEEEEEEEGHLLPFPLASVEAAGALRLRLVVPLLLLGVVAGSMMMMAVMRMGGREEGKEEGGCKEEKPRVV